MAGANEFQLEYYNTFCCGARVSLDLGQGVIFEPPGGVPEPATWAMMIVGFGAAGSVLRRRYAAVQA
jgi:hypothetical protein